MAAVVAVSVLSGDGNLDSGLCRRTCGGALGFSLRRLATLAELFRCFAALLSVSFSWSLTRERKLERLSSSNLCLLAFWGWQKEERSPVDVGICLVIEAGM